MRTASRSKWRRPRLESLEGRAMMATLPAGFAESTIASGIANATAMEIAPDGRVWVLEQGGKVDVFHPGSTVGFAALTIPASAINTQGERGLLGIAFDPAYDAVAPGADYVYLYYTATAAPNPHNRVVRYAVNNSDPDRPTLSGGSVVVDLDPLSAATNYNGGAIHFGPDGKLYVAVGENNTPSNAQSLNNRLGKILRYNADGTIPADNPTGFAGISGTTAGANRAIWAVGLRNPYTFTFQPGTGTMHINDVGQNSFEEIDIGAAGANYGWPITEGNFDPAAYPAFTRPYYAYAHGTGVTQGFAITGGAFYNPAASAPARFPSSYEGDYFFADFSNGWIDVIDAGTKAVTQFASGVASPVDLRVAADGSLLYLSRGAGIVSRIVPPTGLPPAITGQPQPRSVAEGRPATFSVVTTGSTPLDYQWERAEATSSFFNPIAGATGPTYTLDRVQAGDNGARFRVVLSNAFGALTSAEATLLVTPPVASRRRVPVDYDGDGRTDLADYLPALGVLAYRPSSGGADVGTPFGIPGPGRSIPVDGDYDGDGRADVAAYLVAEAAYAYRPSGGGADVVEPFGVAGAGATIPTPGDYFGVGHDEKAVYLPAYGSFAIRPASGGPDVVVPFGFAGAGMTLPAVADYDGDGRDDIAAYLPTLASFAIRPSGGGPDRIITFGLAGAGRSIPISGDYDGDGRADLAVYLPSLALFAYRPSGGGSDVLTPFGAANDGSIPVPGDYSGSGRTEIAFFHPPSATFASRPSGGGPDVLTPFGSAGVGSSLPAAEPAGSRASTRASDTGPVRLLATSSPSALTVSKRSALPRRPTVAALQAAKPAGSI